MATYYWVGGSGTWNNVSTANWSTTSGGAGGSGPPNNADTVIFDSNSGTSAVVTVAATAVALNTTVNKSDITLSFSGSPTLAPSNGFLALTAGTIALNNNVVTVGRFTSNNSNARTIDFGASGEIVITTNNTTVWNTSPSTNMVVVGTNPKVVFNYSGSTGTRTIATGNVVESNAISWHFTAGTDIVTVGGARDLNFTGFSGSLTNTSRFVFGSLTLSPTMTVLGGSNSTSFNATSGVKTITTNGVTVDLPIGFNGIGGTFEFQDALTQGPTRGFVITNGTVRLKNNVTSVVGVFSTSGTNQKFLQSSLAGSQATLSQASGTVNANNLTIQDINATGGATWNAFVSNGNVDAGNNTGWDFFTQLGKYIYTRRKNKRILL
jgi:hypothetical protein